MRSPYGHRGEPLRLGAVDTAHPLRQLVLLIQVVMERNDRHGAPGPLRSRLFAITCRVIGSSRRLRGGTKISQPTAAQGPLSCSPAQIRLHIVARKSTGVPAPVLRLPLDDQVCFFERRELCRVSVALCELAEPSSTQGGLDGGESDAIGVSTPRAHLRAVTG